VSPRLEVGVRLPDNAGEFVLGYRFFAPEGTGTLATNPGPFAIKSRLSANVFDLDYRSMHTEFAPRWDFQWLLGARVAAVYYDTTSANSQLFTDRASNYFVGVGPHGGFEVQRQFGFLPAFSLFGRLDGGVLVGQARQRYNETFPDSPANPMTAMTEMKRTTSVPFLSLQAGLNYNPPGMAYLHFSAGYQYEAWWALGQIGGARLDLTTQGVFVRAEFDF
jgi:hypothetical protein